MDAASVQHLPDVDQVAAAAPAIHQSNQGRPTFVSVAGIRLNFDDIEPLSCRSFRENFVESGKPYFIIARSEYPSSKQQQQVPSDTQTGGGVANEEKNLSNLYDGRQFAKWLGSVESNLGEQTSPRDPLTNIETKQIEWYLLLKGCTEADFVGVWEKKPLARHPMYSRFLLANLTSCDVIPNTTIQQQFSFQSAHDVAFIALLFYGPQNLYGESYSDETAPIGLPERDQRLLPVIRDTFRLAEEAEVSRERLCGWATKILVQPILSFARAMEVEEKVSHKVSEIATLAMS